MQGETKRKRLVRADKADSLDKQIVVWEGLFLKV